MDRHQATFNCSWRSMEARRYSTWRASDETRFWRRSWVCETCLAWRLCIHLKNQSVRGIHRNPNDSKHQLACQQDFNYELTVQSLNIDFKSQGFIQIPLWIYVEQEGWQESMCFMGLHIFCTVGMQLPWFDHVAEASKGDSTLLSLEIESIKVGFT